MIRFKITRRVKLFERGAKSYSINYLPLFFFLFLFFFSSLNSIIREFNFTLE